MDALTRFPYVERRGPSRTNEIAHRLVNDIRHPNQLQFDGAQEPSMHWRISRIVLDPITCASAFEKTCPVRAAMRAVKWNSMRIARGAMLPPVMCWFCANGKARKSTRPPLAWKSLSRSFAYSRTQSGFPEIVGLYPKSCRPRRAVKPALTRPLRASGLDRMSK